MLDSLHRVLGTTDADWAITHQPTKERYDVAMEEVKAGNPRASGRASYARLFFPSGGGDYESTRGLDNEGPSAWPRRIWTWVLSWASTCSRADGCPISWPRCRSE